MTKHVKALEERTVNVVLTKRELTLIRVALLQRLDRLKTRTEAADRAGMPALSTEATYNETRELMQGKLWAAVKEINA